MITIRTIPKLFIGLSSSTNVGNSARIINGNMYLKNDDSTFPYTSIGYLANLLTVLKNSPILVITTTRIIIENLIIAIEYIKTNPNKIRAMNCKICIIESVIPNLINVIVNIVQPTKNVNICSGTKLLAEINVNVSIGYNKNLSKLPLRTVCDKLQSTL